MMKSLYITAFLSIFLLSNFPAIAEEVLEPVDAEAQETLDKAEEDATDEEALEALSLAAKKALAEETDEEETLPPTAE